MPKKKIDKKEDLLADAILRPTSWSEYIGQKKIKNSLRVIIDAAKKRKESIDHLLFYGPAGVGKTTLAHIVASEFGSNFRVTSGTALKKSGDLAAVLSSLEDGDILFIDECHRIGRSIEEMLYPAMESRQLHIVIGKGLGGREISLDLPQFSLVAATTRPDLLSSPLRSRFGGVFHFDYYEPEEIEIIIRRSAKILNMEISDEALKLIARASRYVPRLANRLVKRSRDLAEIQGLNKIDADIVSQTLKMLEIDEVGLENFERKLLRTIIEKFNNEPVGILTLSSALGEERKTIEEIYEPFLIKIGFLNRTNKGRIATDSAFKHLKIKRNK